MELMIDCLHKKNHFITWICNFPAVKFVLLKHSSIINGFMNHTEI